MTLMTAGYEGWKLAPFFGMLLENGVETLVDVREIPISRKPGFSKTALRLACERYGLTYKHVVALGCPKEIRHDYRDDGDWGRYTKRFLDYLGTQKAAIVALAEVVRTGGCCLMCFEADFYRCHRSMVADWTAFYAGTSVEIRHLEPLPADCIHINHKMESGRNHIG